MAPGLTSPRRPSDIDGRLAGQFGGLVGALGRLLGASMRAQNQRLACRQSGVRAMTRNQGPAAGGGAQPVDGGRIAGS
ncbi:Uncharacterised protein [Mycobacteroides abscessus subsp. abscessus]|nr:Uncharacterised protein [Mycobacteroides abscessus subsp. abscessus]